MSTVTAMSYTKEFLEALRACYGVKEGDARWEECSIYDVDGDGHVGYKDLGYVGAHLVPEEPYVPPEEEPPYVPPEEELPEGCYTREEIEYCQERYGTGEGDANFDSICDIDGDGHIGFRDIGYMTANACPVKKCIIATVFLGEEHSLLPPMRRFRDRFIPRLVMDIYYCVSTVILRKIGKLP